MSPSPGPTAVPKREYEIIKSNEKRLMSLVYGVRNSQQRRYVLLIDPFQAAETSGTGLCEKGLLLLLIYRYTKIEHCLKSTHGELI